MDNNIVYVKTKNGIFKCYKSETMHKPIYHPVNGSGYIDYNDVEKILTIDDLFEENQKYEEVIDKINHLIKKHYYSETDDYYDYFTEGICLQDGDYQDLLDILKEVE